MKKKSKETKKENKTEQTIRLLMTDGDVGA